MIGFAAERLLGGLQAAERAVPDRQVWRRDHAVPFHLDEQFAPALGALPSTGLEAGQLATLGA